MEYAPAIENDDKLRPIFALLASVGRAALARLVTAQETAPAEGAPFKLRWSGPSDFTFEGREYFSHHVHGRPFSALRPGHNRHR
jgi:hypothetical protein